jgi:dipeptidyl aminopeptidase/acylaminoacyl peptidase
VDDGQGIAVEQCIGLPELTEPRLTPDGRTVVFLSAVSGEAATFVRHRGGESTAVALEPAPRPGRGLGGGCWCFDPTVDGWFYAAVDGNVWHSSGRQITDVGDDRAASCPVVTTDGEWLVYVIDQAEVWATRLADGTHQRLDAGTADFVLDPAVSPDGDAAAWMAWSVPDMPWDAARLQHATLGAGGRWTRSADEVPAHSVQQPRYTPDGTRLCLRDDTGWLNVWLGDAPLVDEACEHGGPTWGPGQRSAVPSPDGSRVAFTRNEAGFGRLCVVDVASGHVTDVARGVHGQLHWQGGHLCAVRTGAVTPTQIVVYDTISWDREVVASVDPHWPKTALLEPAAVTIPPVHARLFTAHHPRGLLCWVHGGPSDQWQVTFMPRIAYWASAGYHVLVVDHRGSTGHGRAFQQALRGQWGVLDVADVAAAIAWAHEQNLATPATTVVIGGSAGGFTALGVAAGHPHLLAGVVASYPVCDLADLAGRSHRFERHYHDSLIGPTDDPATATALAERSPLHQPDLLAATPMLLLHGSDDPVVPVDQTTRLAVAVREAGGDVELCVYDGEGHGFRQPANQRDEYGRIGRFLQRVVVAR